MLNRRREYEPLKLNGDAHHSLEADVELRIRPVALFSKTRTRDMIADRATPSHRILYVGASYSLPTLLQDALDCLVVRCPGEPLSHVFLKSQLKCSLLIVDEGKEAAELERFARSLPHRKHTPVVIFKQSEGFCQNIGRLLAGLPKT